MIIRKALKENCNYHIEMDRQKREASKSGEAGRVPNASSRADPSEILTVRRTLGNDCPTSRKLRQLSDRLSFTDMSVGTL